MFKVKFTFIRREVFYEGAIYLNFVEVVHFFYLYDETAEVNGDGTLYEIHTGGEKRTVSRTKLFNE